MGSKLDAMKVAAKKAESGTVPRELPSTDSAPPVVYRCGHKVPLKMFLNGDCPACRNKQREAKAKAKREKWGAKQEKRPALGRLPDGSVFYATYDAVSQSWTGSLTVDGQIFATTASGLQKGLLSELDAQYRAAFKEPPQ